MGGRWRRILALFCLPVLLAGCTSVLAPAIPTPERPAAERQAAVTARAQRGDMSGVLNLSGEIQPRGQQTLTSRVSGRVERIHADVGGSLQEGQPAVELEPTLFALRVAQAEASQAATEARLAGLGVSARPEDRQQAEAALRAAQARLQALQSAPRGDTPEQLLARVQAARQRVSQLESGASEAQTQAEAAVTAARTRLEQLARDPQVQQPQGQALVGQARLALQQAEQAAAELRRNNGQELSKARQEMLDAQDQLILARVSISEADLEAARLAVASAEASLRQASTPATPLELRAAEADARRAVVELEAARLEAREATVLAPFSGQVSALFVTPGALVAPGTPLMTVIPPNFEVRVSLPESQLALVAVGQPARVGVDAYPGQEFGGAVRAIAPSVDSRDRTVAVRIEIADPAFRLKTGMFAQLSVAVSARRDVLLVPREALVTRASETAVFQVIDGRARRVAVQVGASDGRNVEIQGGLADGAEVVISPAAQSDGAPIR
jgi:multidrug efflux pump subunit AcrA (membrane-fusion protein)